MNQLEYEALLETYDELLKMGKIDKFEYSARVQAVNKIYVEQLDKQNAARIYESEVHKFLQRRK